MSIFDNDSTGKTLSFGIVVVAILLALFGGLALLVRSLGNAKLKLRLALKNGDKKY